MVRRFFVKLHTQSINQKPNFMKKIFKILLYAIAGFAVIVIGLSGFIQFRGIPEYSPTKVDLKVVYTSERAAEGQRLASMLCCKCHLNNDGNSLSGKMMADLPTSLGVAHSANITQDKVYGIGNWTDGQIAAFLRTAVKPNGKYVPPYMPKFHQMSDEDIASIISWLRSDDPRLKPNQSKSIACEPSFFMKFLTNMAFKPLPYPQKPIAQPNANNPVELGRYCVQTRYQCYSCHSADFATNVDLKPEESKGYCGGGNKMPDYSQKIITTLNITFDKETGIGKWSFEDFDRALRFGLPPNNKPILRYPMDPYVGLKTEEVRAIYEYLKTIPKISNEIDRGI